MINVAVIGAGAISGFHIEGYLAFPERCRVVAVADIDVAKARRQIAKYRLDAVAVGGIDAIVTGPGVDLASVCTPPATHAEIAGRLLQAGIHTLCEKPMAPSLAECDAILAAAQRSGAILSVVAQNRFTTPMMKLKQVLDSGLAGRVLHAQVDSYWWRGPSYYDLWWRGTWQSEGGGCTLNNAVHHIDALQWMVGMPVEIQAMGRSARSPARSCTTVRTSRSSSRRSGPRSRCRGRRPPRRSSPMAFRGATRRPSGPSPASTTVSPSCPARGTPARSATC